MKILKQKILFLLYFYQNYGVLKNSINEKEYLSYNFLYQSLFGFKPASIRKAVLDLVKEADLDKINRDRQVYFRLTLNGVKKIKILFSEFFCQNRQKRGWFMAVLKKKKAERETVKKLIKTGFARYVRGVYLLPADRDLQDKLELWSSELLLIFVAKLEFTDEKQLIGSLWPVDRQLAEINIFIRQVKKLLRRCALKKELSNKDIKSISALSSKFFILIKKIIGLPKNLLPNDWPLPLACNLFSQLLRRVR